jgi:hypothetical protein
MQRKYRVLREEAYEEGVRSFDELAVERTFRDFVCLYIAEGYKRNKNTVSLSNSDPAVMRVATHWVRRLSEKSPIFSLQYHTDQSLEELRSFWGGVVHVEPTAIRAQRKSNSNQLTGRVWRSRYGVLSVEVYDTLFRARMEGWMERLRSEWR